MFRNVVLACVALCFAIFAQSASAGPKLDAEAVRGLSAFVVKTGVKVTEEDEYAYFERSFFIPADSDCSDVTVKSHPTRLELHAACSLPYRWQGRELMINSRILLVVNKETGEIREAGVPIIDDGDNTSIVSKNILEGIMNRVVAKLLMHADNH